MTDQKIKESVKGEPGVRVVSIFGFCKGLRGVIEQDCGSFAYVRWDCQKHGVTSEDYDVLVPESCYEGTEKDCVICHD